MSSPSPVDRVGFAAYRVLPRVAGWGYLAATSLGRLPLSMVPLAILTLASTATGSIAVGGLAASAAALGEAIGGPASGALADRIGQRPVLLVGVVLHLAVLLSFALSAGVTPDAATIVLAGLAGLSLPQVGALSRARWLSMAPAEVSTAFAFEGVVDEIVYIIGPALVGIVAVAISPQIALLTAGALVAVFVTQFAVHRSHRTVPRRAARDERDTRPGVSRSTRQGALIAVVFVGMLSMGVFFGSSQTGLTAFASEQGIPGAGALLYAAMAVGSAVTTLSMVLLPERIGTWTRWSLAGAGMTMGGMLMLFAPNVPLVVAASLIAGAFQGPLLLTVFGVAGSLAERGRAGILMTFTASGVVLGLGVGTALAGVLAEVFGAPGAFAAVVGASALLLVIGLAAGAISHRAGARRADTA